MVGPAWINWLIAIIFGVLLILELAFRPETLYPRRHMLAGAAMGESDHGSNSTSPRVEVERTTNLPFVNLKPIPGMRHPRPWDSLVRFGLTFRYPVVVLTVI